MRNIEGIIFDMDGTLFDTERISFDIWQKVFKKYGFTIGLEEYIPLMGRSANNNNRTLVEVYGDDLPIKKIRNDIEAGKNKAIFEDEVPVKPGAVELLDFLSEKGYKTALATSTCKERAISLLENSGLKDKFSVIICGDEVKNSKPNPEIFLKAAERMKADPEKCIVLEDSPAGIEAAYKGGMIGINIPDLKKPDDEIKRFSHKICHNLLEVKDYISKLD